MLTFINIFLILDFSIQFDGEWPICSSAQEAKADGIKLQVTEPKQHDTRGALRKKDRDGGVRRGADSGPTL